MDSQPKERPILFSAPMVRALIEGRKTQTRRVVNMPIASDAEDVFVWYAGELRKSPNGCAEDGLYERTPRGLAYLGRCPFGNVGARLYVREATWKHRETGEYRHDDGANAASWKEAGWRRVPGIHMPRSMSRITLTITDVRAERLQDISERDAEREGLICWKSAAFGVPHWGLSNADVWERKAVSAFRRLWNSIHGPGAWDANPWVWALTFTTEVRK